MISVGLFDIVECPDCRGRIAPASGGARCGGCQRAFDTSRGYLDLRPAAAFAEQTKYLDAELHADARHESIAPPLLGSRIRNDMLRRFLDLAPGDRVIDLGCGNGRAIAWNAASGAALCGIDISPYFAAEAVDAVGSRARRSSPPAVEGRRLQQGAGRSTCSSISRRPPFATCSARRAACWRTTARCSSTRTCERTDGRLAACARSIGSPPAGAPGLAGPPPGAAAQVGPSQSDRRPRRTARGSSRSPAFASNASRTTRRSSAPSSRTSWRAWRSTGWRDGHGAANGAGDGDSRDAVRAARTAAQARVRRRGLTYRALVATTAVMKLDVLMLGRVPSGPFFALLRKIPKG